MFTSLDQEILTFCSEPIFLIISTTLGLDNNTTFPIGLTSGIIDNRFVCQADLPLFYHSLLLPFLYIRETFFSSHFKV
jgi:hypothetical protein